MVPPTSRILSVLGSSPLLSVLLPAIKISAQPDIHIKSSLRSFGFDIVKYSNLVKKPMDESHLEVLTDPAFQVSINEVKKLTLLDTARLANLWQLCRMSNCPASAPMRQIGRVEEGRISGSS